MQLEILKAQDDRTSTAVCKALHGDAAFTALSASEGQLIIDRDREDESKLAVGIDIAVKKGVLPRDPHVSQVQKISVVGKSADEVAAELLEKLGKPDGHGHVIVLQGLSGTGKGTTVKKLQMSLPKCVCWSNGNVFRSVTHLVSEHCTAAKIEFSPSVLTADLLSSIMKRLTFERFGDEFDVVIDGNLRVSTICNTLLKATHISSRVPTVAEQTQGEVVNFASGAVKTLTEAGHNVILEGRAQTLNYIATPHRFELYIEDPALLGERRAAQRVMAEALKHVSDTADESGVKFVLQVAAKRLTLGDH